MCWNAEVSLQSFGIGIAAILIAYAKGLSLPMVLFCLTIVFMQLIEYIVWTYYDNPQVNYWASVSAAFLLWLQPIASILTLPSTWIPNTLGVYILFTLLGKVFNVNTLPEEYKMYKGPNGHLVWNWLQKDKKTFIELLIYFVFLFFPLVWGKQWLILGISLSTLLVSLYTFYEANTWGSMWCWLVNYIVVGVAARQVLVGKP